MIYHDLPIKNGDFPLRNAQKWALKGGWDPAGTRKQTRGTQCRAEALRVSCKTWRKKRITAPGHNGVTMVTMGKKPANISNIYIYIIL